MDLTGYRGRQVALTLRLSTETLSAPLLPCYTSVILIDNLRFV